MTVTIIYPNITSVAGVGAGKISGDPPGGVTIDNVSARAEVLLFRRNDSKLLRRLVSHSDGSYSFDGLEIGVEYDLVARDLHGLWDDVIAGRILPFKPLSLAGGASGCAVGVPYTYSYTASGGEPPYTFALTGSLPAGLSLSTDGVISGTPLSGAAPSSFTVTVTDARSASASFDDFIGLGAPRKFWRLSISAGNGNNNTSIWEMRIRASPGSSNLAVGGTAFANTEYSGTFAASKAFDSNLGTRWAAQGSNPFPHIIGYELPAAAIVDQIELVSESSGGDAPRDFVVQSSADGASWSDEWTVTGQTGWANSETRVFNRP